MSRVAATAVEPIAMGQLLDAVVADLSRRFPTEEAVVEFLLEMRVLPGSWELVAMGSNSAGDIDGFWRLGVRAWLDRDLDGGRLRELRRVNATLRSGHPELGVSQPSAVATEPAIEN